MSTDVSAQSLKHSFAKLEAAAECSTGTPSHLLRFYAVECGLKGAILRRGKLRSTAQLAKDLRVHDLRRLAKELKIAPASCVLNDCRRPARPGAMSGTVSVGDVHEAWRYGASLHAEDQLRFVEGLGSLVRWCRGELR
jgi:hypothetical protein